MTVAESATRDPIRDYLRTIIKQDDELIEHLLKVCYSAETSNPLNLVVIAPTSEGKTWAIVNVTKLFPNAITFTDATAKSFFYEHGELVDEDGKPIQPRVDELRNMLSDPSVPKQVKQECKAELRELLAKSRTRVRFDGKILVFLDAPRHDLWSALKPLLSHDKRQMIYQTVDKPSQGSQKQKKVLLDGWPASIFATARDEDQWQGWPEIKSRVIEVSPRMDPQKYEEANKLTSVMLGMPSFVLKKIFPEDAERLAKDEVERIRQQIQLVKVLGGSEGYTERDNFTYNIFSEWLEQNFPHETGMRLRQYKILLMYINLNAYEHMDFRPKVIIDGHARAIMPTWEDVVTSLRLIMGSVIGIIPEYKVRFWRDYILPAYEAKARGLLPLEMKQGQLAPVEKPPKYEIADLSVDEIRDYAASRGFMIGPTRLRYTYVRSLVEAGYLIEKEDEEDRRKKLYRPVKEMGEIAQNYNRLANDCIFEPDFAIRALEKLQQIMSPTIVNYEIYDASKNERRLATNLLEVANVLLCKSQS